MKLKTYVLMVAKYFPQGHPSAGQETGFAEKLFSGEKLHTIRQNFDYWNAAIDQVNAGRAVLSVRQWSGKPYNSKQVEIAKKYAVNIQPIPYEPGYEQKAIIAKNDGLSLADFDAWFPNGVVGHAIIHFSDKSYNWKV